MENSSIPKKAKVRLKTPNPLFEKWLYEWHLEEVSEENQATIYSKALESLRKFPLVLKSGLECIILEHFDDNLCIKLNKKLEEHKHGNGIQYEDVDIQKFIKNSNKNREKSPVHDKPAKRKKNQTNSGSAVLLSSQDSPSKKKSKPYVPLKRSAAYGLLIALLLKENEVGYMGFVTKAELIVKAQYHCDVSLKKAAPGTYYSGWSSMSQLISKGLVERSGNPAKFSLSEKGRDLAKKLRDNDAEEAQINLDKANDVAPELNDVSPIELVGSNKSRGKKKKEHAGVSDSSQEASQQFETEEMIFLPNSFDVILLVDTAETAGSAKRDEDEAIIYLRSTGIKFEVRHLKVGDYIWVARDPVGREMVLPYIVERKRLDDLASSIKDGRFHEQKFRIKQSGLPNRIYLVEDTGCERNGLPIENLLQSITNTMVSDKFSVRVTKNLFESMRYLATVTNILTKTFQKKTLFSCKKEDLPVTLNLQDDIISLLTFPDFSYNMGKAKILTPREIFAKQLVQLHGLSADKAWVITEQYGTPKELIEGFLFGNAESVISELSCGILERKVGTQLAMTLKSFYTTSTFTG